MRGARAASRGLLSRTPMTAALTPAYLSELSADIRAAIVLGAGVEALAVRGGGAAPAPHAGDPARGAIPPRDAGAARGAIPPRDIALAEAARAFLAQAPVVRA